ncbi:Bacterial Ig-like domain (group 2) [Bacteroidales bacterium Barb6XT]|nr:Bacterial Ig-like domain (group 2) [Bacteroidales bacterium Barb6XT]
MRTIHIFISCFFLLMAVGNVEGAEVKYVTTSLGNNTAGSFRKVLSDLAEGDTLMFADSLKGATITLSANGIFSLKNNVTVIGDGAIIAVPSTNAYVLTFGSNGSCTMENLTFRCGVTFQMTFMRIKNCTFETDGTAVVKTDKRSSDSGSAETTIFESCLFTGRTNTSTKVSIMESLGNYNHLQNIHFVSCTFTGNKANGTAGNIIQFIQQSGRSQHPTVHLTNCVMVDNAVSSENVSINVPNFVSHGYNVIKGTAAVNSGTPGWQWELTDATGAGITNPLVLDEEIYKVIAAGAAYNHLPANTEITDITFPKKDVLGNEIDYTKNTHSGAVQTAYAEVEAVTGINVTFETGATVFTGDAQRAYAAVLPATADPAVTWSSSDPAVATIDETTGAINALTAGTTTIKATSVAFPDISGEAVLTVNAVTPVTTFTLERTELFADRGFQRQLRVKELLPANANYKEVIWESGDAAIASIDAHTGLLTPHAAGETTITAKTDKGRKTATCAVTVRETGDYTRGVFGVNEDWFGHNGSSVNYIYPEGDWNYNVYQTLNNEALGTTTQFGTIYGGRFYLVNKQGGLVVADALTMIKDTAFRKTGGDGRAFVGVNDSTGYLGTAAGIFIVDLKEKVMGMEAIHGAEGDQQEGDDIANGGSGIYSGQVGSMLRVGERVFVIHQKNGLLVINANTHQIETVLPNSDSHRYYTLTQSKDGYLWACTDRTGNNVNMTIRRIDPWTLETTDIPLPFSPPGNEWLAWRSDAIFASTIENKLYWRGCTETNALQKIYSYNIDTKESATVLDLSTYDDHKWIMYGTSIRIHPGTDEIYAAIYKANMQEDYRTIKFNPNKPEEKITTYQPKDHYWFPATFVFPDNEAPVISLSTASVSGETRLFLGDKVTDADNLDAAIIKSITGIGDKTLISARIWRDSLIIAPLKTVTEDTPTALTLKVNSNGKVITKEIAVTVKANAVINIPVERVAVARPEGTSSTLKAGQTLQLTATVTPADATDRAVRWTSGTPSVATVSAGGLVTAAAPGTAVITAAAGGIEGTLSVTVEAVATDPPAEEPPVEEPPVEEPPVEEPPIVVNPFELNRHTLALKVSQTAQLGITAPQSYSVAWRSTDMDVAVVNGSGQVLAVGAGTAQIIAEDKGRGKADFCAVTVTKADAPAVTPPQVHYTLRLNTSQLSINEGDRVQLDAVLTPEPEDYPKEVWSSSRPGTADVTASGSVIGLSAGSAVITVTMADTLTASCVVTVRDTKIEAKAGTVTADAATISFPKLSAASYYLVTLYERLGVNYTLVVVLKVNPDGSIAAILRSSAGEVQLRLGELKPSTRYEADIEAVSEKSGRAEVVSTFQASFQTQSRTGTVADAAAEANAYYANGLLHLENLEGYTVALLSPSGQVRQFFKPAGRRELRYVFLPAGMYILTATGGDRRQVFKVVIH